MTRDQQLAARRRRNQVLAHADAAHRCAFCKRGLPALGVTVRLGDDRKYCSAQCLDDADEVAALRRSR